MITVYGASDDLIEVMGDTETELDDEFPYYPPDGTNDPGAMLGFSDGTVLNIRYSNEGDGVWRITPEVKGTGFDRIDQCTADDPDRYSDRAYLRDVSWVVFGTNWAGTVTR